MRNFNLSRMASAGAKAGRGALAFWPLLVVACSVYDETLVEGISTPLGGGSGSAMAGTGGTSSSGAANEGGAGASAAAAGTNSGGTSVEVAGTGGGGVTNGGSSSSSGSGGAAGTTLAGSGGEPPTDVVVVDDMEDGDSGIEQASGRNGYWYAGNDGTAGTMTPPANAFAMTELSSDRSMFAASLKASGFTSWGSVMGFNFVEQATVVKAYNASAYCSVQFWGKAAANTKVRVRVPDGDTHPNGNVCKDGAAADQACYDHFGAYATFTTAWKQFSVVFAATDQLGTGYHPADMKLKTDKLYALEWALPGAGASYQIWVDDVELVKCP